MSNFPPPFVPPSNVLTSTVVTPRPVFAADRAEAMSAYQLAKLRDPSIGTLDEWLASLHAPPASLDANPALGTSDAIAPTQNAVRQYCVTLQALLESALNSETADRIAAVAAEAAARTSDINAATSAWTTVLVAETTARVGAVNVLQQQIDAIDALLASDDVGLDQLQEVVDYIKANRDALESLGISSVFGLSTALTDLQSAIDAEASARSGADSALQTQIGAIAGSVVSLTDRVDLTEVDISTIQTQMAGLSGQVTLSTVSSAIGGSETSATLEDSDTLVFREALGSIIKRIQWSNVKSALQGLFVRLTGGQTIQSSGAAVKTLILKAFSGQSANLFEIQNSGGTALVTVGPTGNFTIGAGNVSARLSIKGDSANPAWDATYGHNANPCFRLTESATGCILTMYSPGGGVVWRLNTSGDSYSMGGNLGLGTSTPAAKLDVVGSCHISSGGLYIGAGGIAGSAWASVYVRDDTINPTSPTYSALAFDLRHGFGSATTLCGVQGAVRATNTSAAKMQAAIYGSANLTNTSTAGNLVGVKSHLITIGGTNGSATTAKLFDGTLESFAGTNTIGTLYGMYVGVVGTPPTTTTSYGLYVGTISASGTRWGVYQQDTSATNYFGGPVMAAGNITGSGTNNTLPNQTHTGPASALTMALLDATLVDPSVFYAKDDFLGVSDGLQLFGELGWSFIVPIGSGTVRPNAGGASFTGLGIVGLVSSAHHRSSLVATWDTSNVIGGGGFVFQYIGFENPTTVFKIRFRLENTNLTAVVGFGNYPVPTAFRQPRTFGLRYAKASSAWTASTAIALNEYRRPVVANGRRYHASVAGTTGGSEPAWPTAAGGTVVDGTVTWTESGMDGNSNFVLIDTPSTADEMLSTVVDTGIAAAMNTWYDVVISHVSGATWKFTVNGVDAGNITMSNSNRGNTLLPVFKVEANAAAQSSIYLDYFIMFSRGITR